MRAHGDATYAGWKDLGVEFIDDRFAAYGVGNRDGSTAFPDLTTEAGIKVGSTVVALRQAYGDRVVIPGLPPDVFGSDNFQVSFPDTSNAILGSLSSTTDSGQVTSFFTMVCE